MKIYKKDLLKEHIGIQYYDINDNSKPRLLEIIDIEPFTARDIFNENLVIDGPDYINIDDIQNKISRQFLEPLISQNKVVLLKVDLEQTYYAYPGLINRLNGNDEIILKPIRLDNLSPCLSSNYLLHLVGIPLLNNRGKNSLEGSCNFSISLKLGVIEEFIVLDKDTQEILSF